MLAHYVGWEGKVSHFPFIPCSSTPQSLKICELLDGYKLQQVLSALLTSPFKYLVPLSVFPISVDVNSIYSVTHAQTIGVIAGPLNLSHLMSSLTGNIISFIFKVYPESNHLIPIVSAVTTLVGTTMFSFLKYGKFSFSYLLPKVCFQNHTEQCFSPLILM